jgi:xanthine/uracil/vitamin C permease (AzgA family)
MVYFQSFVSAMVATALIVVAARVLMNFFLSEPRNYIPSLCVGVGFLIGHYSLSASINDPDTVVGISEFCGSAVCLLILGVGFRHRATRTNVG